MHPIDVGFVGIADPFLGSLSDFVLYLPLGGLGFTACGDVLNVCHDIVHGWGLTAVRGCALGSVVAGLVTPKASNYGRVTGVSLIRV